MICGGGGGAEDDADPLVLVPCSSVVGLLVVGLPGRFLKCMVPGGRAVSVAVLSESLPDRGERSL